MDKQSTAYTFLFALAVCAICSFTLAAVSEGLRPKKEMNAALDVKKNILKAVVLKEPIGPKAKGEEILEVFKEKIEEVVIDESGEVLDWIKSGEAKKERNKHLLYIYREEDEIIAYCFPVEGKGLWSTLYGYLALEPDGITVRGITFYKHGETPGLGAEIEQAWFQDNFKGKKVWDAEKKKAMPIKVIKGKVKDKISAGQTPYSVDGISGATMTSQGVTDLLAEWNNIYEPFLNKIRNFPEIHRGD